MAEPWNRVDIPFPSAVYSVRVHFSSNTDVNVKTLLLENEKVLKLVRSEILQTEIRVLYELLHILNNSFRGHKTFNGLKQVEQCVNRLKSMKLDVALQELTELCPNRIKRGLGIKVGECDVPSQPFLEWLCLKVLGAAQLMSCTLDRCSRAFILAKRHMKLEEFVILNVVITSMLSRLWVIFRGVLARLDILYQGLLELLKEVASAQPMPFLKDFSLPSDMTQFLGHSDAFELTKQSALLANNKEKERQLKRKKTSFEVKNHGQTKKVKEDCGIAVERGRVLDTDLKPFLGVFRNVIKGKRLPKEANTTDEKELFKKQVRAAPTAADMMTHLQEMIAWCKSQKMKKKGLLTAVSLKCQRLKYLESAGYNIQRKLRHVRREALWTLSPRGSAPRTCWGSARMRSKAHQRNRFHSVRSRFKSSAVRAAIKKKRRKRKRKRTDLSVPPLSGDDGRRRTSCEAKTQTTGTDSHDDIDDIFASLGL